VNALRAKLVFLVLLACLLSLSVGAFEPISWWDGT
jgi:hypothetical protein